VDFGREGGFDDGVGFGDVSFGAADDIVDLFDDPAEEGEVAFGGGDDAFPVPLIDVDGVGFVEGLVGADGVHVGVDAFAWGEAVVGEGHAFPLGEGLDDFGVLVVEVFDGEGDGTFDAVEVVVDACVCEDEEGRGDAEEVECVGEIGLEALLDEADGAFGLAEVEEGFAGRVGSRGH